MTNITSAARLMWEALREIFDENAYARFLRSHRLEDSRESYRHYLRESDATRERRPRCC
ncbi:MAG TPA: hypothetical protein VEG32_11280 [Clostridia bacterium]|nr:hypothetical protein [Clostridia bacterium]